MSTASKSLVAVLIISNLAGLYPCTARLPSMGANRLPRVPPEARSCLIFRISFVVAAVIRKESLKRPSRSLLQKNLNSRSRSQSGSLYQTKSRDRNLCSPGDSSSLSLLIRLRSWRQSKQEFWRRKAFNTSPRSSLTRLMRSPWYANRLFDCARVTAISVLTHSQMCPSTQTSKLSLLSLGMKSKFSALTVLASWVVTPYYPQMCSHLGCHRNLAQVYNGQLTFD